MRLFTCLNLLVLATGCGAGSSVRPPVDASPNPKDAEPGGHVDLGTLDAGARVDAGGGDLAVAGSHDLSMTPVDASSRSDMPSTTLFPAGTLCNSTGHTLKPPTVLKHVIVFLLENEDFGSVNGNKNAPYISSLAAACGYATSYNDNCFADNLVSLPHYLALSSGSNCNTGLDKVGTGCITDDKDPTAHTLTTASIFSQVSSWKAYQEGMPGPCAKKSGGVSYACKHNPPAYYTTLASCSTDDVGLTSLTCDANAKMTACTTPSNALTDDIANDTLPAYAFVTPNLLNDMHDGSVTEGDNWLYTYLPLILASKSYLRGEVAVLLLWDEQSTTTFGGATPNVFISPYISAGTQSTTPMNHFAVLRAIENALGISTYLGCASGTQPGGGACPAGSTADVRSALGF